jgi:single-strand DNA-binding protein
VNQSTKNQQTGEWVEATDWFRVSVWGDRAERAAENLRKGNRVLIDGRFRTREYETKDGRKGLSLEITADNVVPLDRREQEGTFAGAPAAQGGAPASGGGPGGGAGGPGGGAGGFDDTEIDELPF